MAPMRNRYPEVGERVSAVQCAGADQATRKEIV